MSNETFDLQRYLNWSIAICYHPMFMLIDEDRGEPAIGERVPPWGAATADEYLERVKRNLASLENDQALKLNYEWAAAALADIQNRYPEVFERMLAAHQRGQLGFVGGDYALVHNYCSGSEACWRLIEYGQEEFERLLGQRLRTFAHQETHVHEQLPQILRKHGYEYAVAPSFPWTLTLQDGGLEIVFSELGAQLNKGNEFVNIQALNGDLLPAYIPTNVRQAGVYDQIMRDSWAAPTLWIDFPDLEEYINPMPMAAPVILEQELEERISRFPVRATGRMTTKFSYTEGVWAEEHLRAARRAEEAAVLADAANAFAAVMTGDPGFAHRIRELFMEILKYEDHDVTWIEVTDLRRKAIDRLNQIKDDCATITQAALTPLYNGKEGMSLVNLLPYQRRTVVDMDGIVESPLASPAQWVGERIVAVVEMEKSGAVTCTRNGPPIKAVPALPPSRLQTDFYSVEFSSSGLIREIQGSDGSGLLAREGGYLAGEIRAVTGLEWVGTPVKALKEQLGGHRPPSDGIEYTLSSGEWIDNRTAECAFEEGPVCSVMTRVGRLGSIPFTERYIFYKEYPAIQVELDYDFDNDSLGDMHLEETKLNVYLPTKGLNVHHDVPFGYVSARQDEQLFATNYVHCGGIALIHRGSVKSTVRDGVISNTLAWGSKFWTNRLHFDYWMEKCPTYDLRLNGRQSLSYWIYPSGEFDPADLAQAVDNIVYPLLPTAGSLNSAFLPTFPPELRITSSYVKDGVARVRGYKLPGSAVNGIADFDIFDMDINELRGLLSN